MSGEVFLDLKKAFNTVDHRILCCKLLAAGVSNSSVKWFDSYHQERSQVTKVGNHPSMPGIVTCGVQVWAPVVYTVH